MQSYSKICGFGSCPEEVLELMFMDEAYVSLVSVLVQC